MCKFYKKLIYIILFSLAAEVVLAEPAGNPAGHPALPPPPAPPLNGAPPANFPPPPPPPKDADHTFKYRGTRTYNEDIPLKINQTKCNCVEKDFVCLQIIFNNSINPRSVKAERILINNHPMPENFVRFAFNKKGDTIKIFMPMRDKTFKLKLLKIRSFDGSVMEPIEILVEVQDSK